MKSLTTLGISIVLLLTNNLQGQCTKYISPNPISTPTVTFWMFAISNITPNSAFTWDFGDGSPLVTITDSTISHTYTSNGTFVISAYDTTSPSCIAYDTIQINTVSSCAHAISVSSISSDPLIYFQISNPSPLVSAFMEAYEYDFGDGSPLYYSSLTTIPHHYLSNGTFVVSCRDTSLAQCIKYDTITISGNLSCGHSISSAPSTSLTVDFNLSNPSLLGPFYGYEWDFGDSSGLTFFTDSVVTHTYQNPGTYVVSCRDTGFVQCYAYDTVVVSGSSSPNYYQLSGELSLNSGLLEDATIFLITLDTATGYLEAEKEIQLSFTDSSSYSIDSVLPGSYFVKAALDSGSASYSTTLPTYFGTSPSIFWSGATSVVISNSNVTGIDFTMLAGTNSGGPGFVEGYVSQGANKRSDSALSDVTVLLLSEDSIPIRSVLSDNNGFFRIENIPLGNYIVFPEFPGLPTTPLPVTLTSTDNGVNNISVLVRSSGVSASVTTGIFNLENTAILDVYPNPVDNIVNIAIRGAKAGDSHTLQLLDARGKLLIEQSIISLKEEIDLSDLNSGFYVIRIEGGSFSHQQRIIVK